MFGFICSASKFFRMVMAALAASALVVACTPPPQPPPSPVGPGALSLGTGAVYGNGSSAGAAISANGNIVAFSSQATNLVPGDDNDLTDTFVRDRVSGQVIRVAEQTVSPPKISRNGRWVSYVAFGGTFGVYDRNTGTHRTWNTTVAQNAAVVPDDGSVAIFGRSGSFGLFSTACIVRDLSSGTQSDCPHQGPGFGTVALEAISGNGRYVLYYWFDQEGGTTSGRFVWDRSTDAVTPAPSGLVSFGDSTAISDDGKFIAAINLATSPTWSTQLYDLDAGTVRNTPGPVPDGHTIPRDISPDGSKVVIATEATNLDPDDTNGALDIYIWDTAADTLKVATKALGSSTVTPNGSTQCGFGGGSITTTGDGVCLVTIDALAPSDTNGAYDAWLLPT